MRPINNFIVVQFDDNTKVKCGGIELIRPETWVYEQDAQGNTKYQENLDGKVKNPQIATVIKTNKSSSLKEGDKVFVHYLTKEMANYVEVDGKECWFVNLQSVFFRIKGDGDYEMSPDTYLGERVVIEAPKTKSGIWTTPYEDKPDSLKVKITHVPENACMPVGSICISSDSNHYELEIDGKKYVKLTGQWMPAKVEEVA